MEQEQPEERKKGPHSGKKQKEKKDLIDMFDDSDDDESKAEPEPTVRGASEEKLLQLKNPYETDDEHHYYRISVGDLMNKDFRVTAKCGKGVFGNVVKATHSSSN
jgi:hypothetical protein